MANNPHYTARMLNSSLFEALNHISQTESDRFDAIRVHLVDAMALMGHLNRELAKELDEEVDRWENT